MGRASDDMIDRRRDEYVASSLGIPVEALAEHSYELDDTPAGFAGYAWRVVWQDTPPQGVAVNGEPGSQWSDIPPYDWQHPDGE